MGKTFWAVTIIIGVSLSASVWAVDGDMGVGTEPLTDGSEAYPWLIEDLADFDAFAGNSTYWAAGVHTKLMTDIDLYGRNYTRAVISPDTSTISGFQGTEFTGIFNGGGHAISNLRITTIDRRYIALFGNIGSGGEIKNLRAVNVDVQGYDYVGGLAGMNYGAITSCSVSGEVIIEESEYVEPGYIGVVGGLVGINGGTISSCYAAIIIDGPMVGGLAGENYRGTVTSCHATGTVSGGHTGGLVGANRGTTATIRYCYATCTVSGYWPVGGLIGDNYEGTVSSCYATGTVSGSSYVGGLAGQNGPGTISSCYATGVVGGYSYVGGLIGQNYRGRVIQSYSVGRPTGTSLVGGLCGSATTGVGYQDTGNFWDTETSQIASSTMGTGKTTDQMISLGTFTGAGWDFTNEDVNGTSDFWRMCAYGVDYPRLSWESAAGDFACPDGVGFEDLEHYAGWWLETPCEANNNYCGGTDMDYSGSADLEDFAAFAGDWMKQ